MSTPAMRELEAKIGILTIIMQWYLLSKVLSLRMHEVGIEQCMHEYLLTRSTY